MTKFLLRLILNVVQAFSETYIMVKYVIELTKRFDLLQQTIQKTDRDLMEE